MKLGAHLSAAGGVWRAAEAAPSATCEALQVFLRPPGRWAATAADPGEAERFARASAAAGLDGRCFAHAPYLLNLAAEDEELRERSRRVLVEELQRAGRLGLAGVVLHPGSAGVGGDREAAVSRCRDALAAAVEQAGSGAARVLVEGAAGAGGQVGTTPGELARLAAGCRPESVGLCLDLAHMWAAGYDLRGDGWPRLLDEVGETWARPAPHLWHGNDTPSELGSRRDRHAAPGEGRLGERFFREFLADERAAAAPLVVEIPPGDDNANVREALSRLRGWQPCAGQRRRKR
ncbi:MAG TPA: deoxyribonuclease IV [Thermoanaerobaculaceae bacterium]|nr:deoxyribonuclease IV [Thermoanaerobaculaceae bacterium]HRS15612.1 deoxyribonuclease IV [Thermoanaerobaculaceae bacterium]